MSLVEQIKPGAPIKNFCDMAVIAIIGFVGIAVMMMLRQGSTPGGSARASVSSTR
jgi:uncharacterized membrane protein